MDKIFHGYAKILPACFTAVLGMLLLAGCGKDNTGGEQGTVPQDGIIFEIGFAPQTRASTDADFSSAWEDGDEIGVYVVESGTSLRSSGNFADNLKLNFQNGVWNPSARIYYPNDGGLLDFYAYYPYIQDIDPLAHIFTVSDDQSSAAGYAKSDLLLASAGNIGKSQTAVQLIFSHAMALVQVDISEKEINVPQYREDKLTVKLKGVKPSVTLSLGTTAATDDQATETDIVMCRVDTGNTAEFIYRALIPAQEVEGGHRLFHFEQDADDDPRTDGPEDFNFHYITESSTGLSAARVAKYKIKLTECDPSHRYGVGDAYPHAGKAVGIVYMLDTGHEDYDSGSLTGRSGKVIALDTLMTTYGILNDVLAGAVSNDDGLENMSILCARMDWETYHPFAARLAAMNPPGAVYASGARGLWYAPSLNEAVELRNVWNGGPETTEVQGMRAVFDGWLTDLGGKPISPNFFLLTSTELNAAQFYYVVPSNGNQSYLQKNTKMTLRPILLF